MKEITKMDGAGIEHMIREEGLKLTPYLDTKGIPTIAVGNTYYENGKKVRMTDPAMSVSNYAAQMECTPPYIYKLWKIGKANFEIVIFSGNNYIIPN